MAYATAARPQDRYQSVDAMADDARRFLNHYPVQALPASLGYQARKLVQRRWPWVLAGSLTTVALAAMGFRIDAERTNAERERDAARTMEARAIEARKAGDELRLRAQSSEADAVAKRKLADASSQHAEAETQRATQAEQRAIAQAEVARQAEKLAKSESEVSNAKSTFFAQVFSDFSSVHHLNASSTLKDLLNAAKKQFAEGRYARGNLDARYQIADLLAGAYGNIGDVAAQRDMALTRIAALQSMQRQGGGNERSIRQRLANAYLEMVNLEDTAGERAKAAEYARQFTEHHRPDDLQDQPMASITGRIYALALQSTPPTHAKTSEKIEVTLDEIARIQDGTVRKAVNIAARKMTAIFHAKAGEFRKALGFIEQALTDFPKEHGSPDTVGNTDLGSLLLEKFTYLYFLDELEAADAMFPGLEALLKE